MTRLPGALFVVDIKREHIAVKEAKKLNIPVFAMVDTNSDPRQVDFVIPSNDDATKSISKIMEVISNSVIEGLSVRKAEKEGAQNTSDIEKNLSDVLYSLGAEHWIQEQYKSYKDYINDHKSLDKFDFDKDIKFDFDSRIGLPESESVIWNRISRLINTYD